MTSVPPIDDKEITSSLILEDQQPKGVSLLEDTLGLPNFGDILQNLLPDDDLPRHKYLRGIGARILLFGLIVTFVPLSIYAYTGYFVWPFFGFTVVVALVGLFLFLYGDREGKEIQEIDRKEREVELERKQSRNKMLDDQRATLKDRRQANFSYADDEMEFEIEPTVDESVTIEPEDDPTTEMEDHRKPNSTDEKDRDLEYEK